jgi:hypothetical protein
MWGIPILSFRSTFALKEPMGSDVQPRLSVIHLPDLRIRNTQSAKADPGDRKTPRFAEMNRKLSGQLVGEASGRAGRMTRYS